MPPTAALTSCDSTYSATTTHCSVLDPTPPAGNPVRTRRRHAHHSRVYLRRGSPGPAADRMSAETIASIIAGIISTTIFAASTLPILWKAGRTTRPALLQPGHPATRQHRQRRALRLRFPPAQGPGLDTALLLPRQHR